MTSTNRNANVYFSVLGAGESKAEIDKIRQAAEALGDKGKKGAQGVVDGLEALQREANNVERKLQTTGVAGERDLRKLIGATEALKTAAINAFGSLANAPVELQHAVQKGEQEIEKASIAVGKLNNAVRDNAAHVQAASNQWSGLSGALEGLGGRTGAFVGKFGLVTAAFSEGWQMGMKLNQLFGTDMSQWDDFVAVTGRKIGLVVRDVTDIVVGAAHTIGDALTLNFKDASRDAQDLSSNVVRFGRDVSAAASMGTSEWNKYVIANNDARFATDAAKESAAKLREEHNKLGHEISLVRLELANLDKELEKQKRIAEDSTLALVDQTSNQAHYQREVTAAASAVEEQKRQVQDLSEKFGESSLVVQAAREKQAQLESSLQSSQRRLDESTMEVHRYEDAQRSAQSAVEDLTKKHKEQEDQLGKLTKEDKKLTDQLGEHAGKANAVASAHEKIETATNKAHTAITNIKEPIDKMSTAMGAAATNLERVDAALTSIGAKAQALASGVGKLADVFGGLGDAAAKAAGDERSSSPEGFRTQ